MALLLASFVLSAAPDAVADKAKDVASKHFEKGVSLFKNEDYSAALIEFEAAYEAQPHFAVRYNLAMCLWKLKKYGEAADQIQRYLSEGGEDVPKEKRIEVEDIYKELDSLVASLKVEANVDGADVYVNGKPRDKTPMFFPLKLDVGEYEIEVMAEGYEPFKRTVKLPGGDSLLIEVDLVPSIEKVEGPPVRSKPVAQEKPAASKKVPLPAFASMAGLTLALALVSSITGGVALKKSRDYRDQPYDEGWQDEQESGRNLAIATDVMWGITGAAAATTIVLVFFTDFHKKESHQTVSFRLDPLSPGFMMTGEF